MSAIWMTLSKVLFMTAMVFGVCALWALWRHHSTTSAVLAVWSAAAILLSGVAVLAWAVYSDHDNLEYGLRPGRLILPILITVATFTLGIWSSIRLLRREAPMDM
jgi:hypothetical protein